ncbi:MAG: DUF2089 domain-containing protein [Planctomycetes bacterium]|nr:DUF2089 domain-containing protein [Planctomycetota bacterium]
MDGDWQGLLSVTRGQPFVVERVRLASRDIAIEGQFEPPPLASLDADDQVFVMAFVRCHGSIKRMEELFGVSYPTIKNRLNRIAGHFEFVKIEEAAPRPTPDDVLSRLERGELNVEEALELLKP